MLVIIIKLKNQIMVFKTSKYTLTVLYWTWNQVDINPSEQVQGST